VAALDAYGWALAESQRQTSSAPSRATDAVATPDLLAIHPFLDRSLTAERERGRPGAFGAYDGRLGSEAAAVAAARLLADPVSASRIERYAECPLRALFGNVMGLRPLQDPAEVTSIDPLHRGLLYHAILAELVAQLVREDRWPARPSAEEMAALHERLDRTAERHFEKLAADTPVGYALLWEVEKRRMRENLRVCLEEAIEESARSGYRPAAFEWTFGRGAGSAPAVAIDLPRSGRLSFQGRIDRIDVHESGRRARVVDYKTRDGVYVGGKGRLADGRSIQLVLYRAAAAGFELRPGVRLDVDAEGYVFVVGDRSRWLGREQEAERRESLRQAVDVLVEGIRAGDFTADPRPGGACGICDFQDPCGESRQRLFGRKRSDPAVAARLRLREGAKADPEASDDDAEEDPV